MAPRCLIGTSGFSYDQWESVFYPSDLPARSRLAFYSEFFDSVEIDYTFYRLPAPSAPREWRESTPEAFRFSVKGSRYITHVKGLRDCREAVFRFFDALEGLEDKLSVVLWQTGPALKPDAAVLETFLGYVLEAAPPGVRSALEFRNPRWFTNEAYDVLNRAGAGLVEADSDMAPAHGTLTGDFAYVRFHGRRDLGYEYPANVLRPWAGKIKEWSDAGVDSYVYFNNDAHGFAPRDAQILKTLI